LRTKQNKNPGILETTWRTVLSCEGRFFGRERRKKPSESRPRWRVRKGGKRRDGVKKDRTKGTQKPFQSLCAERNIVEVERRRTREGRLE